MPPKRYWGYNGEVYSSIELAQNGIHKLRCVHIGVLSLDEQCRWEYADNRYNLKDVYEDGEEFIRLVVPVSELKQQMARNARHCLYNHRLFDLTDRDHNILSEGHVLEFHDQIGSFLIKAEKL